jgi:hypothetical protein
MTKGIQGNKRRELDWTGMNDVHSIYGSAWPGISQKLEIPRMDGLEIICA